MKRLFIAEPKLKGNERKYVMDCLDSNWISSNGKYIHLFERSFANFCNVKHAIATNNGTTALHLALVALGLQPGDEVLVPTVTYIATANAVRYCGAIPIFVDVCPQTLNIDSMQIEKKITNKTRGIIPVHLYGHPVDMNPLRELALKYSLFIVEDAAEAHGAEYLDKKVGSLGNCAVFSFFGNKIVTTGEGGIVVTNDDELSNKLRIFRGQGMDPNRRYWFPVVGYNYRMTNIQAAIGLAQMENIEKAILDRDKLAESYNDALSHLTHKIDLPKQASWAKTVYWMYTIFLKEAKEEQRNSIMHKLDKAGIETRPVFYPMHKMPPYKDDASYPVADDWAQRGINLPTHQFVTNEDVARISDALTKILLV